MAKRNFSDLGIETLTSLINSMNYVSQNHTLIILSTKCLSSKSLRESAVDEMNYVSQNHTVHSLMHWKNWTELFMFDFMTQKQKCLPTTSITWT